MDYENLAIDQCSLYPLYLETIVSDKTDITKFITISSATGFVYEYKNKHYLVSNWHVFSGRHAVSRDPLDETNCSLPEKIRIYFPMEREIGKNGFIDYPLINESNNTFCWFRHPRNNNVDVGLLPIDWNSQYAICSINQINESCGIKDFPDGFYVGQEVFILGYPRGIKGGCGLPIWKRATIAVEPYVAMEDSDLKMLVDAATREGMFGSPVIVAGKPGGQVISDGKKQRINIRPYKLFLGIYSGRIAGKDELAAQLGIVWKEQAIREIIEANMLYSDCN